MDKIKIIMSKRKQIDTCVDLIVYTMENFHHDKKSEAILVIMLSTMLIFLSEKDIINMMKNKVIPKLSKTAHKDYFEFISNYLNELEAENK